MSENQQLLMLKGMVHDMPAEQQEKIAAFKKRIEAILDEDEDNAAIAMGWIGLERSE